MKKVPKMDKFVLRGEIAIFVSSRVIFGFYDKNYPRKKLCVSYTFEFFVNFEILAIFEISNGNSG